MGQLGLEKETPQRRTSDAFMRKERQGLSAHKRKERKGQRAQKHRKERARKEARKEKRFQPKEPPKEKKARLTKVKPHRLVSRGMKMEWGCRCSSHRGEAGTTRP